MLPIRCPLNPANESQGQVATDLSVEDVTLDRQRFTLKTVLRCDHRANHPVKLFSARANLDPGRLIQSVQLRSALRNSNTGPDLHPGLC